MEVSRDNEELVVQRNSPPAKRPRYDHSPAATSGPQWVEKPTAAAAPKKELDSILTRTGT